MGDKNLSTLMKIPQSQASPIKSNCELAKGERVRGTEKEFEYREKINMRHFPELSKNIRIRY